LDFCLCSNAEVKELDTDQCPICEGTFLKVNIEKHAASCREITVDEVKEVENIW
jgi:hypothetical protein